MAVQVHPSGWDVFHVKDDAGFILEQHVIPADDFRPHDSSPQCWCRPFEDQVKADLWAHNSADRREEYEEGRTRAA